jgi:hypothetical protein
MLAVGLAIAAVVLLAWYWCFTVYNRRKAYQAVTWVEDAFQGHASVGEVERMTGCEFHIPLRVSSSLFRQSLVRVCLHPRHSPMSWLWWRIKKRPETLIFEANFDLPRGHWRRLRPSPELSPDRWMVGPTPLKNIGCENRYPRTCERWAWFAG